MQSDEITELIKWLRRPWVQVGILTLVTILLYINTLPNGLVLDDDTFLNWPLTQDLSNLPLFLTGVLPLEHLGDYRPLKGIVLTLNQALFKGNLVWYHIQAIVIHLVSVMLVYVIIRELLVVSCQLWANANKIKTHNPQPTTHNRYIAFFTALIFAIHPVNVEAIAFITSSSDILGINFYLAGFYCFVRGIREIREIGKRRERGGNRSRVWVLLSVLFFLLGLLTYEMVLTLPFMAALYVFCFDTFDGAAHRSVSTLTVTDRVDSPQKLREKIFLLLPLFTTLFFHLLFRFGVLKLYYEEPHFLNSIYASFLVMGVVGVKYLLLLIFSWILNVNHLILPGIYSYIGSDVDSGHVSYPSIFDPRILGSFIVLLSLLILAVRMWRKHPEVTFGILWIAVALIPVANIFPIPVFMSERYLYLASVGYALLVGLAIFKLPRLPKLLKSPMWARKKAPLIIYMSAALLVGFYFVRSYIRIADWRSEETLWKATLREVPESMMANHNLGMAYFAKGDILSAAKHLEFATGHNWGRIGKVHLNLGKVYLTQKKYTDALSQFEQAVALDPKLAEGYFYIGNAYLELKNDIKAEEYYFRTLALKPGYTDAHRQLAAVYAGRGDLDEAARQYKELLALNPLVIPAYYDLASVYIKMGDVPKAEEILRRGIEKDPDSDVLKEALNLIETGEK